ncbi:MAG: Na+/H+ antiporter [Acidobacteriaceae bacterium]|nr:Na+/H+ antiporter [Acidobacteriaceae bacterium]
MQASDISRVELILLVLLLLVAGLAILAKRLRIAYPIVLVLGGVGLSILQRVPRISLDPNIGFLVFLPPLLFSAAFHTSWRDFRNNLVTILLLAFGLVGFTMYAVAGTTRWMLPGFDWRLGLVLGAVVSTTDAIAATATAKRLGLPRKITDVLEAESLVNDGSGLVALKFTLAIVVTGVTPSFSYGIGLLLYLISMGVIIGLFVGVLVHSVQRRIHDAPIEITISLVTPYIVYLAAESAGCSGVLATLACGLYLGRRSSGFYSLHARIESSAVWRTLDFILNGLVFLLLGLQLPYILSDRQGLSLATLIKDGALFSLLLILLRLLWVFPGAWISSVIRQHLLLHPREPLSPKSIFLVGWSGMRGVLALAAAMSLPEKLMNGARFPERNLIIFLTFCAIFATLVLQGLPLPALIRALGLADRGASHDEEDWARRQMVAAALKALRHIRRNGNRDQSDVFNQIEHYYRRRLALLEGEPNGSQLNRNQSEHHRDLAQQLRDIERATALRLRDENKIHDEVLRVLERDLDFLDAHFTGSEP